MLAVLCDKNLYIAHHMQYSTKFFQNCNYFEHQHFLPHYLHSFEPNSFIPAIATILFQVSTLTLAESPKVSMNQNLVGCILVLGVRLVATKYHKFLKQF